MALDATTSPRTHTILGCLMEVHRELGPGFDADVYLEAAALEFGWNAVPFVRDARIPIWFEGHLLDVDVRAHYILWGEVLLTLAATAEPTEMEEAALRAHLRASRLPVGLLVHFGGRRLHVRRFARLDAGAAGAPPPAPRPTPSLVKPGAQAPGPCALAGATGNRPEPSSEGEPPVPM